jgi:hypothetical protein
MLSCVHHASYTLATMEREFYNSTPVPTFEW